MSGAALTILPLAVISFIEVIKGGVFLLTSCDNNDIERGRRGIRSIFLGLIIFLLAFLIYVFLRVLVRR